MTVAGRVLDPDGKPVKGAVVDLVARPRSPWVGASDEIDQHTLLGQGQSDGDGRFQLDSPRTASTRVFEVTRDRRRARVRTRLGRAEPRRRAARGRHPAPARAGRPRPAGRRDRRAGQRRRGERRGRRAGRATRAPTTASPSGRARPRNPRLAASGQDRRPGEDRIARHRPRRTGQPPCPRPPLRPAGPVRRPGQGSARQGDRRSRSSRPGSSRAASWPPTPASPSRTPSSRPRPWCMNEHASGFFTAKFRADDQGRFAMNPIAGESYTLGAFPTGGEPYLIQQDEFKWTKGAVKATHDIKLRRGVLIRGKVTEAGTGRPLAGVEHPVHPGPRRRQRAFGLAGDRGQPGRRLVPDRRAARQGAPARLRPDRRLRPRGDRLQPALLAISPAGNVTAPTPSSPTRSRPATRPTRSPRRSGRA